MQITVKLYGALRRHRPASAEGAPHEPFSISLPDGQNVAAAFTLIQVPPENVTAIAINGQQATPDTVLQDGDTLYLFPPAAGG